MSGHSHWAGIKHRKGINDAKKGKVFTKHGKLITIAARDGGGKPEANFQLRLAIERARLDNMPKENIERAIKRGTGELNDGTEIKEIIYEGYGPGQVAMLVSTATDNSNRTVGEIKNIFTKNGGKVVPSGSVSYLFKSIGMIEIALKENTDIDDVEMKAIEAGAEETEKQEQSLVAYLAIENLQSAKESLEKSGLEILNFGPTYLPTQKTNISSEEQQQYEKLLEALDDQDDVQEIYDNL